MSLVIGPRTHLGETDLLRYLDRQLDREALRRARHHLANCPPAPPSSPRWSGARPQ